jgi:hypothetical protein
MKYGDLVNDSSGLRAGITPNMPIMTAIGRILLKNSKNWRGQITAENH